MDPIEKLINKVVDKMDEKDVDYVLTGLKEIQSSLAALRPDKKTKKSKNTSAMTNCKIHIKMIRNLMKNSDLKVEDYSDMHLVLGREVNKFLESLVYLEYDSKITPNQTDIISSRLSKMMFPDNNKNDKFDYYEKIAKMEVILSVVEQMLSESQN